MPNIQFIIVFAVIVIVFFLFPFWCALVMRKFCKNFSDEFIVRFLAISCSLTQLPTAFELCAEKERYFVVAAILFLIVSYLFCRTLAKAGVLLINRRFQPAV